MTGRHPDLQREIDRAVQALARRLEPVTNLADPHGFATAYINDLLAEGWRPVPRDPRIPRPSPADSDTARRGAQEARAGLAELGLLKEGTE